MLKVYKHYYLRTSFQPTTMTRTRFFDGKTRLYVVVKKATLEIAFGDDERAE